MEFKDLRNESELEFTDISSEEYRVYLKNNMVFEHIESPIALHVSSSGGHRVLDAHGKSYYIKPVWDRLHWKAKEGQPHFVK